MRLAIGADHAGFSLKQDLVTYATELGHQVLDLGTFDATPVDYPDYAVAVAAAILDGRAERGILICGSGVGASVAANKVPGIRAGLCHDTYSAHQGVEHDDISVLVLGARVVGVALARELVHAFLGATFSYDERHLRRLKKVAALEAEWTDKPSGTSLSSQLPTVQAALRGLAERKVVERLWAKDYTVWKPDPTEITNRLGWLTVADVMRDQVPALEEFARSVLDAGFRHVVLLGMGGSSLGPEVLRQSFGPIAGFPELIVLDTTVPEWVQAVTDAIDPARTLFLVSSKSGGTIEVMSLYKHFHALVEQAVGREKAGASFVAITDPGTSLEKMAHEQGFRRVFLNPTDIGGRYSVLSYFGLVPAALAGIDVHILLDRAIEMQKQCAPSVPVQENSGAWLGAAMGSLALQGRDRLTVIISPIVASFGLWVEQLIAESTGKEGKGIVPVVGEPLASPDLYGDDRLFVYVRLEGDDNAATDAAAEQIRSTGQPIVQLELRDRYDLSAEFFRWELATAVAGALLGIQPFDQPNVQQAKDLTAAVLGEYQSSGRLPQAVATGSLDQMLSTARPGDYLAIMPYLRQTDEVDEALTELRQAIMQRHHIPTTVGYGPRFLHSTGQLHKGGANNGLFLQLTSDHPQDVPIPGEPYTFGVLCDAQSLGDLRALKTLGRRVTRVRLGDNVVAGMRRLSSGSRKG